MFAIKRIDSRMSCWECSVNIDEKFGILKSQLVFVLVNTLYTNIADKIYICLRQMKWATLVFVF